jgi:hypothetical protein
MELKEIRKAGKKTLRSFGFVMAGAFTVIAILLFWKQRAAAPWMAGGAALFGGLGLLAPIILKPIYIVWMTFAHYLSFVMTYVILTLFYYIILTPVGLLMRLFGKDLLAKKFPGGKDSYWVPAQSYPDDTERYSKPY